jgi:hypothetical protein
MPLEIFYSYAHADEALRDELEKHLSQLKRSGLITGWHDRAITAGSEWGTEIDAHARSARIILLLISPDFLASEYAYGIELKLALTRHRQKSATIIPIILRPVDWLEGPIGKIQALPRDGKAITTWPNRDEAFAQVALGIRNVVIGLGSTPGSASQPEEARVGATDETGDTETARPVVQSESASESHSARGTGTVKGRTWPGSYAKSLGLVLAAAAATAGGVVQYGLNGESRTNVASNTAMAIGSAATAAAPANAGALPQVPGADSTIRVQVILSEHLTYETTISDGLKTRLRSKLGQRVAFEGDVLGFRGNYRHTPTEKEQWRAEIKRIADRYSSTIELDYIVTVGSLATNAVIDYGPDLLFRHRMGLDRGVVAIGLTDPIRLGFVSGESPGGMPGRAAVQYGSGAANWGMLVSDLFLEKDQPRERRPTFIYDGVHPQDEWVAAGLSTLVRDRIQIQRIKGREVKVEDLRSDKAVYFAWYALDALVEQKVTELTTRTIVPSTFNAINLENFGVVVSVKDSEVGQAGADIITDAVVEGRQLQTFDVGKPAFYTWIDCSVVRRRGFKLSSTLKRNAKMILRPEGDDSCLPPSTRVTSH